VRVNFKTTAVIVILICYCLTGYSQGSTNKGTEFWTAYMTNTNPPGTTGGSVMDLYITSDVNTSGNVSLANGSFSQSFAVTANQVTILTIPSNAYLADGGKFNLGIHITSLKPIAIYAHIFAGESSGATLLLPVNTMGKDYYSINYTQMADETAFSSFMVIATADSTTVEISPITNGVPAGKPYDITLNKGQVYESLSPTDVTGYRIRSISSTSGPCTKIAVFSGSTRIQIGCNPALNSSDNLFQQVYPTAAWGENYITVPLANRHYDVFRIILSDPNTTFSSPLPTTITTSNGSYIEFTSSAPTVISANKPIQVVQYAVSQGNTIRCGNDLTDVGDPEMIYLTPIEQTVDNVTLYSTKNYKILNSYINVLIKTSSAATFTIDGKSYTNFTLVALNKAYSYAQIPVAYGTHNISAANGFNAIAYGFGQYESYGYAAGANLQDLNSNITLQNPQTDRLQQNGCSSMNYNLVLTLPYKTTSITWDFQDGSTPYIQSNPPIIDSIQSGGQTLYIYKYPKSPVNFKKGDYAVVATVFNPAADECGTTQQVLFNFTISDPPVADFSYQYNFSGDSVLFKDLTTPNAVINSWAWNFGDNQTSTLENPLHAYYNAGKYNVTLTITDADGCTSSVQKTVNLPIVASVATGSIFACVGMASAGNKIEQFAVSGVELKDNITATAPPGFEISTDKNSGYGKTVTLTQAGGAVDSTMLYVRSAASTPVGEISGNVIISSAGQTSQNVAVSGTIDALPTVNKVTSPTYINGTLTKTISFTGTANTYDWTNDTPGIGLAASGTDNINPFTAINKTSNPITATITVTPQSEGFAYIGNGASGVISVINTTTNTVVQTIPTSDGPYGIAVSPDETRVYITFQNTNIVSVINTTTNAVVATIPVGTNPIGVAVSPDGQTVYVTNEFGNSVSVINTATNKVVATITVGTNPIGVTVSHDGSLVYVTNEFSNTVSVINAQTNTVSYTIIVDVNPIGLSISSDDTRLYVANNGAGTVSVINTVANNILSSINVGSQPYGLVISPDGSRLYVSNFNSNTVSVINTSTGAVITTINVGINPTGISISPDDSQLYVTNSGANTVSVINTATNAVAKSVDIGSSPHSFGNFVSEGTGCSGLPSTFTITVYPTQPTYITETDTLPALTTTYGTPSASASFMVSGFGLKSSIVVTPPLGFEVSTDNVHFSPYVTIGSKGDIAATKVYIRLSQTAPVGSYSGNVVLSSDDAMDVNTAIPNSTVNPASLTITADNKLKMFEAANPALTVTYKGFVNNENASHLTIRPEITTTAITTSPIGTYPIIASGAASPDYSFTYIPGVLTISATVGTFIPNTFTPNGDGINDTWNIKYLEFYPNCTVEVYNRWGEKVYSSIGYTVPWDGKYKGDNLPTGTYYYIINLKNGDKAVSGYVAIIR